MLLINTSATIVRMQTITRLLEYFVPEHYDLSLRLNRTKRTFDGLVTIKGTLNQGKSQISLHSKELDIKSVTLDGKKADFKFDKFDELIITHPDLSAGKHIVVVKFSGKITDGMHGVYPCYFEHGGVKKELIATQFESNHAHEVFPCVDEPSAKATFNVTLTTEPDVVVLGNMPIKQQNVEDGNLVTTFDTTPKMSTYLLAWVVGELHKVTAKTKNNIEVNVWATPAQKSNNLDFALDTAVKLIDFYEDYFDTPYPLPKSDHVALPDFSSGAMENWGLVTYREVALLVDPKSSSISSKQMVATVIAHELAHQWFGNLVTMKWWDNLWLNESFANMMEYLAIDKLYPDWDMWLEFSTNEGIAALRRDSLDGVQPVQVEVNHPDEISSIFDPYIVYAKGGRLLRMLQVYVGEKAFQNGLKGYFAKFAYQNTDGDDLWSALSGSSGKDINKLMQTWISQPGFPVLDAEISSDNKLQLSQNQFFVGAHAKSNQIWPIPLGATDSDLPKLLSEQSSTLDYNGRYLKFNIGDSAHFITHYGPKLFQQVISSLNDGKLAPIDRLQILHEATLLAQGNKIPTADLIPLIKLYKDETSEPVWTVLSLALRELRKFVEMDLRAETKLREFTGNISLKQYKRLGWTKQPNETEADSKLRGIVVGGIIYSENDNAIKTARKIYETTDLTNIDPDLRPLILSSITRHGDKNDVDRLLSLYKKTQSADILEDIAIGITSTRLPDQIDRLLESMMDPEIVRPQDVARWFVYLIRGRESRSQAWRWLQQNWDWISKTFEGDKSYDSFPRYAGNALSSRQHLEEFKQFFNPIKDMPSLKRVIALGIKEIEGRVSLIERDQPAVVKALLDL